jgi:hypothetical protein
MPTGYTAGVQSGEITSFRDYVMQCARAFGALVTMREDPSDAKIPEEFQPDEYYRTSLEEAKAELDLVVGLTDAEADAMAAEEYKNAMEQYQETANRRQEEKRRYESMLEQARAYAPPSDDHRGLAAFMVSQLEESIKFDCIEMWPEPVALSGKDWKQSRIAQLEGGLACRERAWAEEQERTAKRTNWVRLLRESLKD